MRLLALAGALFSCAAIASSEESGSIRHVSTTMGLYAGYGDDLNSDEWQQLALSGKWRWRDWRVQAGTGWLAYQSGESGLADSWLSATYLFQRRFVGHWWDVRGRIKLPTADETQYLGTGSVDQGVRLQALKSWDSLLSWYYLGYRVRGKSQVYQLQNSGRWGAGMSWQKISLFYDGWQASQPGLETTHSIGFMYSLKYSNHRVAPYLSFEQDGDWSLGISASF